MSRATSWASSDATRASMKANKSRDTKPELKLRSAVHGLGLRFRVNYRPLPSLRRTADLVFTRARVAVFLDGCYWHGCPEHFTLSRTNSFFWASKIAANKARDENTTTALRSAGWRVIRVWEHEDPFIAAEQIAHLVRLG
ncbi:very short patch repair endonuclease [Micromonospora jinlongensis]|uniref:very short patch repair endonuclease n=1 Tax=Micromonospora jinlongensis TaxID=1287877 RepID=UPI00248446B3|nr:very short patch repair endonuclease [Micromonospora jinlongensis]